MKKLLWVGDAGCPSGFAKVTHQVLDMLRYAYDVNVLAINYRGDPHDYPYRLWAAAVGEGRPLDEFRRAMGVDRLLWMCARTEPDIIVIQNDGWNIQSYMRQLRAKKANGEYLYPEYAAIPVVVCVAVDGKNFDGKWLDGVSLAIFWTQFALDEARAGGYDGPAVVIPLGVDLEIYKPLDKTACRHEIMLDWMRDKFIVGTINRNQPRKRWDLCLEYFAEWVTQYKNEDAVLYLQAAPTGDACINARELARYYGLYDRVTFAETPIFYGVTEDVMAKIYSCFDLCISTTQGEGFGLTTLEAMACGVPCIVPNWSALGDWAKRGAWLVPCTSTAVGQPYVNVIGGIPDKMHFVRAMQRLYVDKQAREQNRQAALECAVDPRYRWEDIGQHYLEALDGVLYPTIEPKEPTKEASVVNAEV